MKRDKVLVPLSHQHQHALALCVRLRRGEAGVEDVRAAFAGEIAAHFRAEEQVLFPVARQHNVEAALVDELLAEHREMERRVAELTPAGLADFAQLLDEHIRKEERRLFEAMQEQLPAGVLAELAARIDSSLQE
jgi:hemerythrin-like domain-containing protein